MLGGILMDKDEIKRRRKEISGTAVGSLELQEYSKMELILDILEDMQTETPKPQSNERETIQLIEDCRDALKYGYDECGNVGLGHIDELYNCIGQIDIWLEQNRIKYTQSKPLSEGEKEKEEFFKKVIELHDVGDMDRLWEWIADYRGLDTPLETEQGQLPPTEVGGLDGDIRRKS